MSNRFLRRFLCALVFALPAAASATPEVVEVICTQPCEVMIGPFSAPKSVPKVGSNYLVELKGESSFLVRALPDGKLSRVSVTAVFKPKARMVFDGNDVMPEDLYRELQEEKEDEEREARAAPGRPLDPPTVVVNLPRIPAAPSDRAARLQKLAISEFTALGVNAIADEAPRPITNHWLAFQATQFAAGDECLVSVSLVSNRPVRFDWGPEVSETMSCDEATVDAFFAKAAKRLAQEGQKLAASARNDVMPGSAGQPAKPASTPPSAGSPVVAVTAEITDAALQKRVVALVEEAVRKQGYAVAVQEKGSPGVTHLLTVSLMSVGPSVMTSVRVMALAESRIASSASFSTPSESKALEKLGASLPGVLEKLK